MSYKEEILVHLAEIDNCLHDDIVDIDRDIEECREKMIPVETVVHHKKVMLEGIRYDLEKISVRIVKAYKE